MKVVFIHSLLFVADVKRIGLSDERLQDLEKEIMKGPARPPIIAGTGGVRKIRLANGGGGKSGGARICYAWFAGRSIVYLIAAFTKAEKANLTAAEKCDVQRLVTGIKRMLDKRTNRNG